MIYPRLMQRVLTRSVTAPLQSDSLLFALTGSTPHTCMERFRNIVSRYSILFVNNSLSIVPFLSTFWSALLSEPPTLYPHYFSLSPRFTLSFSPSSSEQICAVISCPLHGFRLRPLSTLSQGDACLWCPISMKLSLSVSLSIRTRCSFFGCLLLPEEALVCGSRF